MTFTIIVPSYGRPDDLRRCLRAILAGNRLPDELIAVVRDTDGPSQAVVAECAQEAHGELLRRVLVREAGQVAAINEGLAIARGDVIAFTDDDTEPSAVWLERLAAGYSDPSVVGVGGRDRLVGEPDDGPAPVVGRVTWYGRKIGNHHRGCAGTQRVQHLKGANMSFRRSALPPFDRHLFHAASMLNDTDASLGAGRHGVLLYDPEALVEHYASARGSGVTRDNDDARVVRADSHNLTYCMLKHLRWWAKPVFIAYSLAVGQGACIGVLKWLWYLVSGSPKSLRQLWASTVGKLEGLSTYLTAGRHEPEGIDPETAHAS